MSELLKDIWYFACLSAELKPGKTQRRFYCGIPVALGRDAAGEVFALRDVCPHRAAPLSQGRQVEEGGQSALECPYHGWRFSTGDGVCAKIPALSETSAFPVANMKTARFPVHEEKGTVWIYIPADPKRFEGTPLVPPPGLETAVFAAILVAVMLFEPLGLYGRWIKIRTFLELFPFYRRAMFKRQKSYLRTERMR